MIANQVGLKIWVSGIVQGVGFRPFIYTQALQNRLTGWVRNTSSGVEIEVSGTQEGIDAFLNALHTHPPPLARIDRLFSQPCPPNGASQFEILASQPQEGDFIPVSPDMSICHDCQRELFDPTDRRFHYPFINCTNCGPRYTIIRDIPYDRPKTTMADFAMCPQCLAEYHNPLDRRFHAQPVACPQCGPHIAFYSDGRLMGDRQDALDLARDWLMRGKILAIKSLGGYHLACDAANAAAVDELRRRKKRSDKPFALMAYDLAAIEKHCLISAHEKDLLTSRQRPIVLLERRPESTIAAGVAPYQATLGVMLPYTPLHLLLLEPASSYPEMLVMTSGNLSEEPIAYQDNDALHRLSPLADGFLLHDRPIHMRVDDSVVRVIRQAPYLIRRARGYAPDPLLLPSAVPSILAAGAELKNTFCLSRQNYAFLSQHIGDLENYETLASFEEGIRHCERLFRIQPQAIACDLHPDYLATQYARQRAEHQRLPLFEIQHHHAHLAACLADNGWSTDEPVIGLSFDGAGLGSDGAIWGGEVLLGGYGGCQRHSHLAYTPLPGGDAAVRKPARMALAHLWRAGITWDNDLPPVTAMAASERAILATMLAQQINSPPTSSIGRLFDAASALAGVRQEATYEGQAAVEFEALAEPHEQGAYAFHIAEDIFDPAPVWHAMLSDLRRGVGIAVISARFHLGVVNLVHALCHQIRADTGIKTVALSGGVWQNRFLLERAVQKLHAANFDILVHRKAPANDGGIALGQVMIAAKMIISSQ
ncbi:MAG: carbamoyltransferase HypF [Anaerolineaceae bacterium]|jgi:hydrogenase maturation protein HypF